MSIQDTVKQKTKSVLESNIFIVALALLSLFLSFVPLVRYVLLPFEFFTTFIHEGSHALASLLMGEEVRRIVLNPDTSGYMEHSGGGGIFARGFIASAGYIGSALVGGLLIVLSAYKNSARTVLIGLALIFILAMIIYVRDIFTLFVCGAMAAGLFYIAMKTSPGFQFFFSSFLAVQTALNALGDVMSLIVLSLGAPKSAYSTGKSDAEVMADLFFLPAIFWSILWICLALLIVYFSLKKSAEIRKRQNAIQPKSS